MPEKNESDALEPQVDRRPDARIIRSALDEVKAIQTLLADSYKDAGDGRTLVRELVQNADDASAKRLRFVVLERGWPEASNHLLRGPALLVVNDGPFPAKDRDALHGAIGGSKADDAGKVGRFGVGLKSVFHICEAFVYLGAEGGVHRPGVLNPWAGTGKDNDADPIHPDWDTVTDGDLRHLQGVATLLLGEFNNGLLLWVPLRCSEHLDRALDRQYGLGQACPAPNDLAMWFDRQTSLALLLAQCGHLRSIEADHASTPETLYTRTQIAKVFRPPSNLDEWVGRYDDDPALPDRIFKGRIVAGVRMWSVLGIEALGLASLKALRSEDRWPRDLQWRDGRSELIRRKALAHAAITILRPEGGCSERCAVRLRWAVFLPLDDHPNPSTTTVVESAGFTSDLNVWDILMHGYFWPSHDRGSIPGVTDDDAGSGDNAIRSEWNRAIRDELLLPLLPNVLASAAIGVPESVARHLFKEIAGSRLVRAHLTAVTRRHSLLPVITADGVRWTALDTVRLCVLSIPNWAQAPSTVRRLFVASLNDRAEGVLFIDADAPKLGRQLSAWSPEWLERLLAYIPVDVLRAVSDLAWVECLIGHVLKSSGPDKDECSVAVARWLAKRISEGALASTATEEAADHRAGWRTLFTALPAAWIVDVPVMSQQAVVELATEGIIGEGLLPIPFGRSPKKDRTSRPDSLCIDRALLHLGQLLAGSVGGSQRTHRSRLLLAETLLSVREDRPLAEDLNKLPLLRAHRLPEEKDESWSVEQLSLQTGRHRVFARNQDESVDSAALETPTDPKRALKDLAEAIGESVWLVDETVASIAAVPTPTTRALALAVLQMDLVQSTPLLRVNLLRRLAEDGREASVRRAMSTLLTGRVTERKEELGLFYVRSQDSVKDANRRTLDILLGLLGRSWCAVDAGLVEPLPHALVEDLQVKAVDDGVLHFLLGKCLDGLADWTGIDERDVLHLLRHLHGTSADRYACWRSMPLHRGTAGDRGSFDDRALRVARGLRLPSALEAEIRLLDPDPTVADLYLNIPLLDADGVLRSMLVSNSPHRFAELIVRALRSGADDRVILPRDREIRALLREKPWLPHRTVEAGVAPNMLLILPDELSEIIAPLAKAGALGDYQLEENVTPEIWGDAEDVVQQILSSPGPVSLIQRLAAALNPTKLADLNGGNYIILPRADQVTSSLIEDAIRSPLASTHPGWRLVRSAANTVGSVNGRQPHDIVVEFARAFCGPIPAAQQTAALKTVGSTHPTKDSPSGRLYRNLIECFTATPGLFIDVLPHLELPTQDGQWHHAAEIARSASGVARRHRVVSDLRSSLRLDSGDPVHVLTSPGRRIRPGTTVEWLKKYFSPWINQVPPGAVGAFLALLGNGKDNAILNLAEEWLGDDNDVRGLRNELIDGQSAVFDNVKVLVYDDVVQGERVVAVNILGEEVEMEAAWDEESVFATDPVRLTGGQFWEITFRDVGPRGRTAHQLIALLGGTVEWWAFHALSINREAVRSWWSRWGSGSQAQVGPVQASIMAHLPLTLQQLNVRENEALRVALSAAQRAQRRREQAPTEQIRHAMDAERAALGKLASLIREDPEQQRFLWLRVQDLMRRFGYRNDSVLLELAQNADDALSQAAEIAGASLPSAVRRLVVRVLTQDGVTTIDVTHHGRPINDTGGAAFPAGRDRQWDQDLYFMMLLNLSGKPGEVPGQSIAASTTGRFGLGFKSVHLVTERPSVVSGFIAFSIVGGLLPQEEAIPDDSDALSVGRYRATRVRLPLRCDIDASELVASMFARFAYTCALLPVFARQLREVVVDGGHFAAVSAFDAQPIDGATGWSVAKETIEISGKGTWRVLRFRPADTTANLGTGTAALAVGLKDGKPAPLPLDVPFLWNVTPTSEGWGCGYAVNGPFKLDPGRTHVSLDDSETRRVIDSLGEALGKGLIELHDSLSKPSGDTDYGLPASNDASAFLASLWKVLASGIDARDELRADILRRLHGPGRGLSVWMRDRSVVPSDLPPPFREHLPPLDINGHVEVAGGGLDDRTLCSAFAAVPEIAELAAKHPAVSGNVADRLRPLLKDHIIRRLDASDLLVELAELWDHIVTPERLHALRPLAEDSVWRGIPNSPPWQSKLVARAADGTPVPLRELLLPPGVRVDNANADVRDELLRSAFAPERSTLDAPYIASPEDVTLFLRLRARHEIDARTMSNWYAAIPTDRRQAALRYLLRGKLQQEVLELLIPVEARPGWLSDYDDVRQLVESLGEDRWRSQQMLIALFPDHFQSGPIPSPPPPLPEPRKRSFFEQLDAWWNDANVRHAVIEAYETKAWPDWLRRNGIADGLLSGSDDHWLGLLVLGACRSLGRAEAGHHRTFLELVHSEGWWAVFKAPDNATAWMDVLCTWQDRATANLTYHRWMSLFPAIYQLSRYREKYRRLLTSAERRPEELYRVTYLLAPRVDEALGGAGQHFDAPPAPLNMGLHWILRELVRLGILNGSHIYKDCWVPSELVLRFLQPLGLSSPNDGSSNSEKALAIFEFLALELKTDTPHLHRAFDIPLRHIASNTELQRRFGLEQ